MRTQCLSFALFLVEYFLIFLILQADDTNIKKKFISELYRMYKIIKIKPTKKNTQQQKDTSEQQKKS